MTLAQAKENEHNLKYKADTMLNYKFSKASNVKQMNEAQLQAHLAQKEARRQEKEENLRKHNEMLEQKRQEKCNKFEDKLNKVDFLKQQEA